MKQKEIADIYPLSHMQQGMLLDTLYMPETGIYTERVATQLNGSLDENHFIQTWQTLIQRHPALRTLFIWENRDEALQVVRRQLPVPLTRLDWRGEPDVADKLAHFIDQERYHPFNLKQAPLFRLTLMQIGADTHYFVLTFHHIIMDRWSIDILLSEFFTLYGRFQNNQPLNLPQPRPYGDYITWLQAQALPPLHTFWQAQLQGFTTPTRLAQGVHQRTEAALYAQHVLSLTKEETTQLTTWGQQQHLTLNTLVQAAWGLLLSHYCGSDDILFGTTVSGRPEMLSGVESIVGLFINTLPTRLQLPHNITLGAWLQQLQQQFSQLRQYEHTSMLDMQSLSDLPSGTPLIESLLVLENIPVAAEETEGTLTPQSVGIPVKGQMAYPFTLTIAPIAEMWLQFTYDTTRFSEAEVSQISRHYRYILTHLAEMATQPLTAVSIMPPTDITHLHTTWAQGAITPRPKTTVLELWQTQVAQTPDAVALATAVTPKKLSFFLDSAPEMPQASLTYAQLEAQANQWAHHLRHLGVAPERVVAVQSPRSAQSFILLLAIMKAGGVYLPIDPATPPERLTQLLTDAQPVLHICHSEKSTLIDERGESLRQHPTSTPPIPTLIPAQATEAIQAYPTTPPPVTHTPANSCYLIYTSGTTGLPKGVLVPHSALLNHTLTIKEAYALTPQDRILQFAALTFDLAQEEIWPTWLAGASLILRPLTVPSLDSFMQLIADNALTILNLTTAYWQSWVDDLASQAAVTMPASLRMVIVGSEKALPPFLTQWQQLVGDTVTWRNGYGPTEATVAATLYAPAGINQYEQESAVPIGRPLPNITTYILDKQLRPLPIGAVGELYLGGAGLAYGYWQRASATAVSFIPNPFSLSDSDSGTRLYRTGDLVRWLPSGDLAFIGRADDQLKVRGYRIEPGEIEVALLTHPQLRQAFVWVRDGQLVAYVLADGTLTPAQLRDFLGGKLPPYMVPSAYATLPSFPTLPNGKLDRHALLRTAVQESTAAYLPPQTELEQQVAAIWQEVLKTERIGLRDNFFELGGHSLTAVQIISRVRRQLEWDVSVRTLFEAPTIAQFVLPYQPVNVDYEDETAVIDALIDELDGISEADLAALAAQLGGEG